MTGPVCTFLLAFRVDILASSGGRPNFCGCVLLSGVAVLPLGTLAAVPGCIKMLRILSLLRHVCILCLVVVWLVLSFAARLANRKAEIGVTMDTVPKTEPPSIAAPERLAYSVQEAADLLGVNYFSVYRLIQRGKLKPCRALRGKLLVPRAELIKLLKTE